MRAALERLVELHAAGGGWGPIWEDAIAAASAALAQPEWEGPSAADLLPVNPPNLPTAVSMLAGAWREGVQDGWNEARAALARWGRPTAPPAQEVGAALADLENLELAFESSFECKVRTSRIRPALLHYATLLQQQAAPAPAVVPVAVSEWEDGFMGGVCVALATVKAHGDNVIWREIVRSVGVDNALNYAANVNPEDWDLAGFSEYAQLELGKDKPLPPPQAGEVQA
jgi:hypothetical protein